MVDRLDRTTRAAAGALLLLAASGCTGRAQGSGSVSVAASTSSVRPTPTGVTNVSSATPAATTSTASAGSGRIDLTRRGIAIDGKLKPLLGAEIQYFRVRDPSWDPVATHRLWEDALDQAQAAGVNLITTYVPWDFHEEQEGVLQWSGTRDLEGFLEMCHRRGLPVAIKPGPFINAEWPNGVGSFGAVPQWWKDKNPASLALEPSGKPFSFALLGQKEGRQPSFFAPDFRAATVKWFQAVAPIIKRYIFDRPTIALLQIDNETNFYFKSRFTTDYSVHGIAQFRAFLKQKYGTVAALNAAWGKSYASFDQAEAPTKGPATPADNLRVQDWFDAGREGIAEYHLFLRAEWEKLGIHEPDVIFTTNDSPHAMPTMDLLLWDGPTKNRAGLAGLDAYPKQFPWSPGKPQDYPFLTSFFTKRFIEAGSDYRFAGRPPVPLAAAYGAELEGGLFTLPLGLPNEIPASTTDQVLLEFFGHGGTQGTVYVFRAGLNKDGSTYFPTAAIDRFGLPTRRHEAVRRFGKGLLEKHGDALLASEEVEAKVALVVGARFDAPAADVPGHPGWIQAKEAPAVFGWLEDAGLSPAVIDGRRVTKGSLDRFSLVVYVNPDAAQESLAEALDDYVTRGGTLLNLLHRGRHDEQWGTKGRADDLLAYGLFREAVLLGEYEETLGFALPPHANFALPNGFRGHLATSSFLGKYSVSASVEVFAHDRTAPFGSNGAVTGWKAKRGAGQVLFLGTSPARAFRDAHYYDAPAGELGTARALARWFGDVARARPILEVIESRARAFARRVTLPGGEGALVFMASRLDHDDDATVRVLDLAALGLDAGTSYAIEDTLTGRSLGRATGAVLAANGVTVRLAAHGTAVLRLTR